METRSASWLSHSSDALDWNGRSRSARLARVNKPLRCRPLEGRRDQKSPLRRCFRPRPPLRAGCAGFASGCQSSVRSYDRDDPRYWVLAISLRAAVRPLVRMPTDRHTATGTCEIGRTRSNLCCDPLQEISVARVKNLCPPVRSRAHAPPARAFDEQISAPAFRRSALQARPGGVRRARVGRVIISSRRLSASDVRSGDGSKLPCEVLSAHRTPHISGPPQGAATRCRQTGRLHGRNRAVVVQPYRPSHLPLRGHDVFGYIRATFRRPE
jgi:hypothetical protein